MPRLYAKVLAFQSLSILDQATRTCPRSDDSQQSPYCAIDLYHASSVRFISAEATASV
jgi:hypothetical protein